MNHQHGTPIHGHSHAQGESCCATKTRAPKPAAPADLERIYTCPMHPEIRQKGPGSCPICGMALEP